MKQVDVTLKLFIILCLTAFGSQAMAQTSTYTLAANGIGPVQLGAKALDLPESVPGLYDSKMSDVYIDEEMPDDEDMPEFATWYFYDQDGETVFTAIQDSLGYICEISICSPKILTPEGIHVDTPQRQLDAIKGAQRIDPDPMADYGRLSYVLNGITYWVDSFYIDDNHSEDRVASITIPVDDSGDLIYDMVNQVITNVLPLYANCSSLAEMESHIEEVRNIQGVEKAYSNGSTTLFVNIAGAGQISFSYFPDPIDVDNQTVNEIINRFLNITENYPGNLKLDQFTIAFQMGEDRKFEIQKELLQIAESMFQKCNMKGRMTEPTVDFFLHDMYKYDYVFLNTHGYYDKSTNVHWLASSVLASALTTEQIVAIEKNKTLSDEEKLERIIRKDIFQQYEDSFRSGSLSYAFTTEVRGVGTKVLVCYVSISQDLIMNSYNEFAHQGHAIVFNSACQSLMGDDALADAFLNRGAGAYIGYDEINSVGRFAGLEFFGRLFSGMSINKAFETLDDAVKKEHWKDSKRKDNKEWDANLHLVCPYIGDYYRLYPVRTDRDKQYSKKDFFVKDYDARICYYDPENHKFTEIRNLGTGKYYGSLSDTVIAKIPLHYYKTKKEPNSNNKSDIEKNKAIESIPLIYGFQLSKHKDCHDPLTLITTINKPYCIFNLADKTNMAMLEVTYDDKESMVTIKLTYNLPKVWLWNDTEEAFFIRPVIADGEEIKNFGGTVTCYGKGGPNDPNRGGSSRP